MIGWSKNCKKRKVNFLTKTKLDTYPSLQLSLTPSVRRSVRSSIRPSILIVILPRLVHFLLQNFLRKSSINAEDYLKREASSLDLLKLNRQAF